MGTRPSVISTFAGCGGSSLGYQMAGYNELLAIDFDKNCEKTFNSNFVNIPFWRKDIVEVKGSDILEFTKLRIGELDLFDGFPPCQGFSVAGKRNVSDKRNRLFLEFIRLIKELQPKVFVMENVPGLSYGEMKGVFNEIMGFFDKLPYVVNCKMLNAKYYGVPQSRKRLIWVGVRKDIGLPPVFPEPSKEIITVSQALEKVKKIENYAPLPNGAKQIFPYIKRGNLGWKGIPQSLLYKYIPRSQKNKNFNYTAILRRLYLDRPSYTLLATFIPYSNNIPIHPTENRYLSLEELLVMFSFPQNFKLSGNFKEKWKQIGNSVPPRMMEAIATTIKEKILS